MLSGKMQWLTFFFHGVANVNGQALASAAAAAAGPVLLVMDVSSFGTFTEQPACIPSPSSPLQMRAGAPGVACCSRGLSSFQLHSLHGG